MNYKFSLAAIVCALFFASCAGKNKSAAAVKNANSAKTSGAIVIDDASADGQNSSDGDDGAAPGMTKIASDGSRINTMYDAFGNRTDSRCFDYNRRIKCILLRAAADGSQKQVFVYAQNGEVKTLPDDMLDKILTLPAKELAAAAGIEQDFDISTKPAIVENYPPAKTQLKPMPSYKFPVQNRQTESNETETIETEIAEPPASSAEKSLQPDENPAQAKRNGETRAANPKNEIKKTPLD